MLARRWEQTFLERSNGGAGDLHASRPGAALRRQRDPFHEGDDAGPVMVLLAGRVKAAT